MKVLFLDIDGVVNCATTSQRHRGFIGIDPHMAFMVGKIVLDTDCKVILSSSWRHSSEGIAEVERQVTNIYGVTPSLGYTNYEDKPRGHEIAAWLKTHQETCLTPDCITAYAILDDDSDMLDSQAAHFFKTLWTVGITPEIAAAVTAHLNA